MFETWLLSEAPERGNEAISVFQSAQCAESGKTPHVVIISDACRTPARDFDTQRITAVSAFPNRPVGGPLKRADIFYACAPGASEVSTRCQTTTQVHTRKRAAPTTPARTGQANIVRSARWIRASVACRV